ncbi:MAG: hypothetical protein VX768_12130, partial [Planctomycetota bacterium]|nr:hypothetical protein [Planctomycetota bacterium]
MFAAILLLALPCDGIQATDEVAKKLLTEFWSLTRKKEADRFYARSERPNPESVYAYALVKSRQHDVQTALEAIEQLHQMDDRNLQSWRLKTWLL